MPPLVDMCAPNFISDENMEGIAVGLNYSTPGRDEWAGVLKGGRILAFEAAGFLSGIGFES